MKKTQRLEPGSYVESVGDFSHEITNNTDSEAPSGRIVVTVKI